MDNVALLRESGAHLHAEELEDAQAILKRIQDKKDGNDNNSRGKCWVAAGA